MITSRAERSRRRQPVPGEGDKKTGCDPSPEKRLCVLFSQKEPAHAVGKNEPGKKEGLFVESGEREGAWPSLLLLPH